MTAVVANFRCNLVCGDKTEIHGCISLRQQSMDDAACTFDKYMQSSEIDQ